MSLEYEDVKRIVQLLDASHFDELHLEVDGVKLELRRRGSAVGGVRATAKTASSANPPTVRAAEPVPGSAPPALRQAATDHALLDIRAPMLGAFYSAPKPGGTPFVSIGSKVDPDTVIGILEVMKLMNSITADVTGEVVEILAKDGELIEHDQVLMRVRPF